jgi:hypothetical protein
MARPVIQVTFKTRTDKSGKTSTKAFWREARSYGTFSRWTQIDTETAKQMLKEQSFDGHKEKVVEID